MDGKVRCTWPLNDELMLHYHDHEWGVPVHDDRKHFEYLVLDAFQAGLSWKTILHKREAFRQAFQGFDPSIVARFTDSEINNLLLNPGIVRNKLKIEASINNAKNFIDIQLKFGSFDNYIWQFTNGETLNNSWKSLGEIPVNTKESDDMSKALKDRGFKFVGTTICYAYMQAAGIVNDHIESCFRWEECRRPIY